MSRRREFESHHPKKKKKLVSQVLNHVEDCVFSLFFKLVVYFGFLFLIVWAVDACS